MNEPLGWSFFDFVFYCHYFHFLYLLPEHGIGVEYFVIDNCNISFIVSISLYHVYMST